MLNTTRTVIEHGIQCPFSTIDFTELLRFIQSATARTPRPATQLIMHQEHWQLEWEIKEKLTPFRQGQKPEELCPCDPECFRTCPRHGADPREAPMAAREGFYSLSSIVDFGGLPDEMADRLRYHHLAVCLEFGIDFQDERDGPSILTLFREAGKFYHVRSALWYFNWNDDDITELFEGDLLGSLVFQLAHLERRYFDGRNLPVERSIHLSFAFELEELSRDASSGAPDQKIPRLVTKSRAGQLELAAVSGGTHNSAYIGS